MPYPGGKGGAGVYQTIINGMPRPEVYVESFLGGGAVMAAKHPAGLNIGVDLDAEVIAQARSRIVENGEVRSALAGCGDVAACADVAMGDPFSPDIASLQHQWVWRCAGFDGRALGS